MKRREFLKTSLTVSTLAGVGTATLASVAAAESAGGAGREYYELRAYRLKSGANHDLLDSYLEKAAIPAWNRLGIKPVGVFVQQDRQGAPSGGEIRDPATVFVLLPHPSVESLATAGFRLNQDAEYLKAGADYLQTPKSNPAFERVDIWVLLAFAGMPKVGMPAYCRDKKSRMFEIRTYESYSETKAQKKVDMFNAGEVETMQEVGLGPIFFGQALSGPNLPHLTYMLSAEDEEAHKKHWAAFGSHPVWNKLKNDPQYADTVSKSYNRFLVPTAYSQI